MRLKELYLPTLKEEPAEAEIISHRLMLRTGMIRKIASGVYTFMPLGFRVLKKIENIVREEMDRIGSQELLMPVLQPAELWQKSGRWFAYGGEMMRLKDRHDREFCLGPTHEELVTSIAAELKSYKDLPKTLYQIQVKFRDEIRPRYGVMRSREFIMKDAYSFHDSHESLNKTYEEMHEAYGRIVSRCGLEYRSVKAASGLIGGAVSEEFHVLADSGEDTVVYCPNCSYAANLEMASSRWHLIEPDEFLQPIEKVETPDKKSVEEVADFLDVAKSKLVKTLIFKDGDGRLIGALIPGHKELNLSKLASLLGSEPTLIDREEFATYPQLIYGYVGPIGLQGINIVADNSIKDMRNFIIGANEEGYHHKNVNIGRDISPDGWADIIFAEEGDVCGQCHVGELKKMQGIEVGHIFQLGVKYSEAMEVSYADDSGTQQPFIMGCYGVGVSRLVAAAIEQKSDEAGIIWPMSIAPFQIHLMLLGKDDDLLQAADDLYNHLISENIEVLYDDRSLSAGIKFAEADLIGLPLQMIVGKKFLATRQVEIKERATGERTEVSLDGIIGWIKDRVESEMRRLREVPKKQSDGAK